MPRLPPRPDESVEFVAHQTFERARLRTLLGTLMHRVPQLLQNLLGGRLDRSSSVPAKRSVLIAALTIASSWMLLSIPRGARFEQPHDEYVPTEPGDQTPFALAATTRSLLPVPTEEMEALQRYFQPRLGSTLTEGLLAHHSLSIHVLRVAGRDAQFADEQLPDTRSVIRTFLDSDFGKAIYGESPLCQSRYGIRLMSQSIVDRLNGSAREAHDHQTLAALAELGTPLSEPINLTGGDHTLQEVLTDAVASFYLQKAELPWTAVAFASYLPPARAWTNKFGQTFTFDDVVIELLDGGFSNASCGGVHVLYALVFLYRSDSHFRLLTESTRQRLADSIHSIMVQIARNQNADGSWSMSWHSPRSAASTLADDSDSRFLVTGHLGELLLFVPNSDWVEDEVLKKAGEWILPELRSRIRADFRERVCPLTHAFCFVRGIAKNTGVRGTSGAHHGF